MSEDELMYEFESNLCNLAPHLRNRVVRILYNDYISEGAIERVSPARIIGYGEILKRLGYERYAREFLTHPALQENTTLFEALVEVADTGRKPALMPMLKRGIERTLFSLKDVEGAVSFYLRQRTQSA